MGHWAEDYISDEVLNKSYGRLNKIFGDDYQVEYTGVDDIFSRMTLDITYTKNGVKGKGEITFLNKPSTGGYDELCWAFRRTEKITKDGKVVYRHKKAKRKTA